MIPSASRVDLIQMIDETGTVMQYEIVTKADHHFFPGLRALLRSLLVHAPGVPVTVLDCGLAPEQRRFCLDTGAAVVPIDLSRFRIERAQDQGKFTPSIYAFFLAELQSGKVTVHLDADTVVLGSLEDLVRAATMHGLAAVPDVPALPLSHQIGSEGARAGVRHILPNLDEAATSFNAGVLAIRGDYYLRCMAEIVSRLIPLHGRLWGNDQALLNLAAFAANPVQPFLDVGMKFNRRPRYRRSPSIPPPLYEEASHGPALLCQDGPVHILHFVGRPKPWQALYPRPCSGHDVWAYFDSHNMQR